MSKLPFSPKIFFSLLAIAVVVLVVAFSLDKYYTGEIALRDLIGGSISALIATYLVHLWLLPAEDPTRGGDQS